jgi:hypothetical protein
MPLYEHPKGSTGTSQRRPDSSERLQVDRRGPPPHLARKCLVSHNLCLSDTTRAKPTTWRGFRLVRISELRAGENPQVLSGMAKVSGELRAHREK